MRILIVDDNYISRSSLRDLMKTYGECDAVSSGALGIEMFEIAHKEGAPYDLITMDIEMPDMRGQETVAKMRELEKEKSIKADQEVKIIMVTASYDMKNVAKSYGEGCTEFCKKPATKESIERALKAVGVL